MVKSNSNIERKKYNLFNTCNTVWQKQGVVSKSFQSKYTVG